MGRVHHNDTGPSPWATGLYDQTATFPGVLRCATPAEYGHWLGLRGRSREPEIRDPLRRFCYDADPGWCRAQRAAGCCHLTGEQFELALARQDVDEAPPVPTFTYPGTGTVHGIAGDVTHCGAAWVAGFKTNHPNWSRLFNPAGRVADVTCRACQRRMEQTA